LLDGVTAAVVRFREGQTKSGEARDVSRAIGAGGRGREQDGGREGQGGSR
jgi:hypothetical protein